MILHLENNTNIKPHIRWMASTSVWKKSTDTGTVDVQIPQAIYDLGKIETGWGFFAEGEPPQWVMDSNLNDPGPRPEDERLWKRGFRVPVYSETHLDGPREFATTGTGACRGILDLYKEYETQAGENPGLVPVVRYDGATPQQIGKGHTNVPILKIEKWVQPPEALKHGLDNLALPKQPTAPVGAWNTPENSQPEF